MKTIDGGNTFIDSLSNGGLNHDVYFKDSLTGIICGEISGNILRTTNSGQIWYTVPIQFTQFYPYIYRETFVGDNGWLASTTNTVYKTTNFGLSWDSISKIPRHPSFGQTFCLAFGNNLTGYSGGDSGKIHKSTNGGYTWIEQNTLQFGVYGFSSIYAYNDSIVWAVGGGSKILYTENGGGILVNVFENNLINNKVFTLHQNFPNPFNPSTKIIYQLAESDFVELKIHNLEGKEIKTLINEFQFEGFHSAEFNGYELSSGIYFYSLRIGNKKVINKIMLLLK